MEHENDFITQSTTIVIDYDGDMLATHEMDLGEFIKSVDGLKRLLEIVAKEYGFDSDVFNVKIGCIEPGSVKTKIIPILKFSGAVAVGWVLEQGLEYGKDYLIKIVRNVSEFVAAKKDADSPDYFARNVVNVDAIQAKLYSNMTAHDAAVNFTQCMATDVKDIKICMPDAPEADLSLNQDDLPAIKISPFEAEAEESTETVNMQLFLVGVNLDTNAKWQFKDNSGRKAKMINAVVLDNKLLQLGVKQALIDFKDKPLLCTVIIKKMKRDGALRASKEFFITACTVDAAGLIDG